MSEQVAKREQSDALSTILGTGDTRAMLEHVEANVRDVVAVARARGFVQIFGDSEHEFFGLPAWQLLGATYGLVPFVEWTRPVQGGWEARAIVKTRDGTEVGAAEAMCTRAERNRRNASDHDLRAMAQTRANRNALRGCLGAALVLAGFDFADPDAPATRDQVRALHTIAGGFGWSSQERHDRAGVASLNDLTRSGAAELIDAWAALELQNQEDGAQPLEPTIDLDTMWREAREVFGSKVEVLRAALERWPNDNGITDRELTVVQLVELVSAKRQQATGVSS